jgi:glyoxylase-like metal-dependent hydrolase (beta-lactamase superfamily II)
MKLMHFLYNAFLIEDAATKIAIDPGLNLWMGKLNSLIPKSEWSHVTQILATHADPDHYWHIDRVAQSSKATIVCGNELVKMEGKDQLLLGPRERGIEYSTRPMISSLRNRLKIWVFSAESWVMGMRLCSRSGKGVTRTYFQEA